MQIVIFTCIRVGFCERGNALLVSVKDGEFINHINVNFSRNSCTMGLVH
jgi:hypothetical protein